MFTHATNVYSLLFVLFPQVSTISSVHWLILPHPLKHNDVSMLSGTNPVPSIFTEASVAWLRDSASYRLTSGTNPSTAANVALHLTAASCLVGASGHEALFALANTSSITLIRMGMNASAITTSTLQLSSNLTRLLTGYRLPNVLRDGGGSGGSDSKDTTAGLALLSTAGGDVLVAALSKGLKLGLWSATTNEFKTDIDLIECIADCQTTWLPPSFTLVPRFKRLSCRSFLIIWQKSFVTTS